MLEAKPAQPVRLFAEGRDKKDYLAVVFFVRQYNQTKTYPVRSFAALLGGLIFV